MGTSRQDFRTLCRRLLGDPDGLYFRDVDLNQWAADAIADYNQYFPQETTGTIALSTGTRIYSLTSFTRLKSVRRVEYPYGEDPPVFLARRPVEDSRGFWGGPYYDLWLVGGVGDPREVVIGPEPTTGESLKLWYLYDHNYPDSDGETLTAPERDFNLLAAFVRWRAIVSLESREMATPTLSIPILSMLGTNARGAKREYNDMLHARQGRGSGVRISWGVDTR